jgi:hypothetical protein
LKPWLRIAAGVGLALSLVLLERRWPLRRAVEPPWRRDLRNLAERPVVEPLSRLVARRR